MLFRTANSVILLLGISILADSSPVNKNNEIIKDNDQKSDSIQTTLVLRQEEIVEGVGEGLGLGEIGTSVGQIVNGVFTGNFGEVFKGTLPFIDDDDVQTGVGTIFNALTNPLNRLWAAGQKQGLQYFGITEPTTVNPLAANGTVTQAAVAATAAEGTTPAPPKGNNYAALLASLFAPGPTLATPSLSSVDGDETETDTRFIRN